MLLLLLVAISTVHGFDYNAYLEDDTNFNDKDKGICTTYKYLTRGLRNYEEARVYCKHLWEEWGADLAVIDTEAKYDHVRRKMSKWVHLERCSPYEGFWVGLSDADTEGTYLWVNGEELSYNKWAPGQPNNKAKRKGEDCTEIQVHRKESKHLFYNDVKCSKKREFICSYDFPCDGKGNRLN